MIVPDIKNLGSTNVGLHSFIVQKNSPIHTNILSTLHDYEYYIILMLHNYAQCNYMS